MTQLDRITQQPRVKGGKACIRGIRVTVVTAKIPYWHLRWPWLMSMTICLVIATPAHADSLTGAALVNALRQGGYVLVMRHANSPFALPDKATANPDNPRLERQLDDTGRRTARVMGEALKKLRIPIGEVWSSPTYRALEAVRFAALGEPKIAPELDEGAQGMQANADTTRSAWLRAKAAEAPRMGTDTILVTHTPNIVAAFGQSSSPPAAGESLVFHPDGKGGSELIARVKIEEWPQLAAAR